MYKAFEENETFKLKKISLGLLELTIDQGDQGGVGEPSKQNSFLCYYSNPCVFIWVHMVCLFPPTDGVARIFPLLHAVTRNWTHAGSVAPLF